jgi:pimeloyl-ACP methyl ester carboxylesterase
MSNTAAIQTGLARVGDLGIAYESVGTGKPALLFIHGIFQDRSYFAGQQAHFSGRRQVVTPDLRGHGDSSSTPEVTIEDFAADVIAVADQAGLERVVLCGHSMGGAVALKVASARPDLVRGVAMLDAVVLFPEPVRQAGLARLVPALATEDWVAALHGFFRSQILDAGDPADLVARVTADVGRARPEFARTFFASLFASDYAEELKNAPCPLLYVHGKVPADLKRLAESRADALVGQAVGGGHYLMLTVPDQINAMLDRFLEVVEAAGGD